MLANKIDEEKEAYISWWINNIKGMQQYYEQYNKMLANGIRAKEANISWLMSEKIGKFKKEGKGNE